MLKKGFVQIYTGHGKGKTTAAFGLAFRAAGDDNKVLIYQFLKPLSLKLSEREAAKKSNLPIEIDALEVEWDMYQSFNDSKIMRKTRLAIHEACQEIAKLAETKTYNVIILDEIVLCQSKGIADINDIKHIIETRDDSVEIVMTGRDATPELIKLADLVSEIKPIKHPYECGIVARKGIEY